MSLEQTDHAPATSGVDFGGASAGYFQHHQLKKGAADWVLLARFGIVYMISGDYIDWNFNLAQGGWGGVSLATLLMTTVYLCMCFSPTELSPMIPIADGGYGFVRSAFGPWGGFLTGTVILIEYAIAPAAIACFIGTYCESLFDVGGWPIYLMFYIVLVDIHILGAGEALKLMFVITAAATIVLGVFTVVMLPHFDSANLFSIPQTAATGASSLLSFGYVGVWVTTLYAIWFFLAVEGVPLIAKETKNPKRDLPRGLIGVMLVLLAFAALILIVGPGVTGTKELMGSGNSLVEVLESAYKDSTWMSQFINLVGLAGLIVSFFSITYAYSRQILALSRVDYLPHSLSLTNRKKVSVPALVVPGVIGFGLSLIGQGDPLILIVAFGATISCVLMMAAYIILRIRRPGMQRPYCTLGDILTSDVVLALAYAAVVVGFLVNSRVVIDATTICVILIGYFALCSQHHLASSIPEEEFAAIRAAERDLR